MVKSSQFGNHGLKLLCHHSMWISLKCHLVHLDGEIKTAWQSWIENALSPQFVDLIEVPFGKLDGEIKKTWASWIENALSP